jgi:hypothetical protein
MPHSNHTTRNLLIDATTIFEKDVAQHSIAKHSTLQPLTPSPNCIPIHPPITSPPIPQTILTLHHPQEEKHHSKELIRKHISFQISQFIYSLSYPTLS